MAVRLSVDGDDPLEGVAELFDWLDREPELRGLVRFQGTAPAPGDLGASDVLLAAVGGGGAVSVLAASLKAFLVQPRRSDVRVVLTSADGRRLEIDAKRVDDVEAVVRAICDHGE